MPRTHHARTLVVAAAVVAAGAVLPGQAPPWVVEDDATIAGELVLEPPTLNALGVEWYVSGDADHDARVEVAYRAAGESAWRPGLPLLRIQREPIQPDGTDVGLPFGFVPPNMFAGSLFDLEPDTDYEVRLRLTDDDGVTGEPERTLRARTRPVPRPFDGGRAFHVYPPDFEGERIEPAFTGLLRAYYLGAPHADWFNAFPARVEPGDTILVHAGTYRDDRTRYGGGMGTVFTGTYVLTADGTAERPITIRAAGDGEVVFDGDGAFNLFNVMGADYNYVEGITIRNTDIAFLAGMKDIAGASGFTLVRSRLEDVGRGVVTDWSGSKDFYIADNVFVGRNNPDALMGWVGATWRDLPGFPQPLASEYTVKVYGSGHVIAHNSVSHFHDGIDHATYGRPEGTSSVVPRDRMPVSIDIHNNDIFNVDDNCIEADGAMHNVRVLRNRCFNHAHRALSMQPTFGGPIYFIRNVVYHAPEGGSIKLHANPSGAVFVHNTLIGEVHSMGGQASNVHFTNNLVLGQGAWPEIFEIDTATNYSSSDYNGFRPNPESANAFGWHSPPFEVLADFVAPRVERRFATLAEYTRATGRDTHSVLVDYDVFVGAAMPDPADPTRLYHPADVDLRLRPGGVAVDAGLALPNVNEGFAGAAPDLGAYEAGRPLPVYGPRPAAQP